MGTATPLVHNNCTCRPSPFLVGVERRPLGTRGYNRLVKFRRLAACSCVFWSISAVAQLSGEFYLEKTTVAPGEPVFLDFKLSNNGPDAVEVVKHDPEQPFCSGVSITVSKDPADPSSCPIWADHDCSINGPLSDLSPLLPGKSRIDRSLLNFHHEINTAGGYWVEAKHFDIMGQTQLRRREQRVRGQLLSDVPTGQRASNCSLSRLNNTRS